MPSKRSEPAVHRGVGLDLDWRPFDAATVERLIQVTRFPAPPIDTGAISLDDVARVLNVIAIWWKAGSDASDAPTDKMVEDALGSLAKALRRECNRIHPAWAACRVVVLRVRDGRYGRS